MKKMFLLFVALLLVVAVDDAYAGKPKPLTSSITWEIQEDGTLVIAGRGDMPNFTRESKKPWSKKAQKIKAIRIEDGITKVGDYAFSVPDIKRGYKDIYDKYYYCDEFQTVSIGSGVKHIGRGAFGLSRCRDRRSLDIPVVHLGSGVKFIDDGAFGPIDCLFISDLSAWCRINFASSYSNPLKSVNNIYVNGKKVYRIVIPNDIYEIKQYAFYGCTYQVDIPEGVTKISKSAFAHSWQRSVKFPSSLTRIEDGAFKDCRHLSEIHMGSGIRNIAKDAFIGCDRLKSVYISDLEAWCKISFENNASNPFAGENKCSLYLNKNLLTDIVIPSSITKIGAYTFYENDAIKSVTFHNSITSIGPRAFAGCNNLSNVTLPNSLKTIGDAAFFYCGEGKLKEVVIPSSVEKIGDRAFYDSMNSSTKLTVDQNVKSIGNKAFGSSKGDFTGQIITLPSYVTRNNCSNIGISVQSFKNFKPNAYESYDMGCNYYKKKEYMKALSYFVKGKTAEQQSNGNNYRAWCARYASQCFEQMGLFEDAVKECESAIELGDDVSVNKMLYLKGKMEFENGNYDAAFNNFGEYYSKTWHRTKKSVPDYLTSVPSYYCNKGSYKTALNYYKKICELTETKNYNSVFLVVACYEKMGDISNAIEWQRQLADTGDKDEQFKLGQLYEKSKNKNMAIFWYKKSAEQHHLKAEEALAQYGVYVTANSASGSHNHSHNHNQTYTPEYGYRDVWVQCTYCGGSGKCQVCYGRGGYYYGDYFMTCGGCNGTKVCPVCGGRGGYNEKQQYQIR